MMIRLHRFAPLAVTAALACCLAHRAPAQLGFSIPTALNTNAAADGGFDGGVHVVASCTGTTLAVWSSSTDLGGIGTDADIFYARSDDAGSTWTAPMALNTNAGSDTGGDFFPRAATDDVGNWIVVWRSHDSLGGTIGTDADIVIARSPDDGRSWSVPRAAAAYSATDNTLDANPDVVTDGAGTWIAVWDSTENLGGAGADQDILMARSTDGGASWSPATTLAPGASSDSGDDFGPTLATDRAGNWVAAWSTYDQTSDIFVSTSADGGVTWSMPAGLRVLVDSGQDFAARLQTDRAGTWIAVWESGSSLGGTISDDQDILFARSTDNGGSWTAPAAVNANAGSVDALDSLPDLTTDRAGNWIVAWHSEASLGGTLGLDADILFAYSNDQGVTWSAERAFATVAGVDSSSDTSVCVAADGRGGWLAAWSSDHDLGVSAGADVDIAVATVLDPVLPDAPSMLNSNAALDTGSDLGPRIATDGQGNCVAVWMSSDDLGATIGTDLDILVARSSDGGATWSQPTALNSNAGADAAADRNPVVATDGAGVWIAIWDSPANIGGTGTDQDIFMARSTNNGMSWSAPTPVNTDAATDMESDFDPEVATDGAGNWVVTWTTDPFDTITAASTNNGISWNAPVLLAASAGADFEPSVATDRAGLWIVVWSSNHDLGGIGDDDDLLICRSTNVGASWSPPATLNADAATDGPEDDDFAPTLATDRSGNWVCAWHREGAVTSTFGADTDVLVARSADHTATWSAVRAISLNAPTDTSEDMFARVSTDGDGTWIVAWTSAAPALGDSGGTTLDTEIAAARSSDAGATWTPAAALNRDAHADSGADQDAALAVLAPGRWLAVWTSSANLGGRLGTDRDILFSVVARAEPRGGAIVNLGGGCGSAGSIGVAGSATIGSRSLQLRLTGGDPIATGAALGISVPGATTTICGGCTINSYFAVIGTAMVGGSAAISLRVPCSPGLRGQSFEFQWLAGLTSQRPCPIIPPVSFTDRIVLTLD